MTAVITEEAVQHVAKLARLALTEDELKQYTQDLGQILALISQLDSLNLDQVDMTLTASDLADLPTVYRADVSHREFNREDILKNAPSEEDGFFRVPQILDTPT